MLLFCIPFDSARADVPTIQGISPGSGPAGASVTITGTGFSTTASEDIVYFGAVKAAVTSASATSLTVTVPAGASYAPVTVTVSTTGLSASSTAPFLPTFTGSGSLTSSSFASKVDIATGIEPYAIAIVDIDGDGKPDLVAAGLGNNSVSVYRNAGAAGTISAASFPAKVDFATPNPVYRLAVGDLDGDGKPDVAAGNYDSDVISVFRNTAVSGSITAGSFASRVGIATGDGPRGIAIGDMDGDGRPDLIVVNETAGTLSVLRNIGSKGTISFAARINFSVGTLPIDAALADLDGDGKLDIVVTNYSSNSVSVFRNTATSGSFTAASLASRVDLTAITNPTAIAIGDVNSDGKPDIAVTNYSGTTLSVLQNNCSSGSIAASSFDAAVSFTAGSVPYGIAFGDLDGDGRPDLAVANHSSNSISLFHNAATGGDISAGSFGAKVNFASGSTPETIAIGDLDGDGRSDIVTVNDGSNTLSIYRNIVLTPPVPIAPANGATTLPALVSLEWDPVQAATGYHLQIATDPSFAAGVVVDDSTLTATDTTALMRNGNTTYYWRVRASNAGGKGPFSDNKWFKIVPASITSVSPGSGIPGSTVTITGTGFSATASSNTVLFGGVKASVNSASTTSLTVTVPSYTLYAPISVLNQDMQWTVSSSRRFLPTFSGSGSLSAESFTAKDDCFTDSSPYGMAAADIDNDGKQDLIVTHYVQGSISVFRNVSSAGTPSAASFGAKIDFATGSAPRGVAAGDLNGDGKIDAVTANFSSNTLTLLRNTGVSAGITAGSFAAGVSIPASAGPRGVAIADINGDGRADIVAVNYTAGTVSVFRNIGSPDSLTANSFAPRIDFTVGTNPFTIATGDLDGDGKPEIVVTNYSSNTISVLRNTCLAEEITAGSFATKVDFTTGTQPTGLAFGDIDGDGKDDLCVSNTGSSTVSLFRNISTPGSITAGSLAAKVDFAVTSSPRGISLADLNGDGKTDIAVGSSSSTISLLRNTASSGSITSGSLGAMVNLAAGYFPETVIAYDMDGDGRTDLAAVDLGGYSFFTYTNQRLYFPPTITSFTPGSGIPGSTVTITGTGFNAAPANNAVLFGNVYASVITASTTSLTVTVPSGALYAPISVLNRTTKLAGYSSRRFLPTFTGSATITGNSFAAKTEISLLESPRDMIAADIDGNGKPELIFSEYGLINVRRNIAAAGSLSAASFAANVTFNAGTEPDWIAADDLNGDGKIDLVATHYDGASLSILRNTAVSGTISSSSFAAAVTLPSTEELEEIAISDLDGDGRPDIVAANSAAGAVSVFRAVGGPDSLTANSFALSIEFPVGAFPFRLAVDDIDGDGKPDILVNGSGKVSVLRNTSVPGAITAGSFADRVDFAAGSGPTGFALGDIDGDGKNDLCVTNNGSYVLALLRNTADSGSFIASSLAAKVDVYTTSNSTYGISLGDISGDGKPDIVLANTDDASFSIFRNIATVGSITAGSFASRFDLAAGNDPPAVFTCDMDGDGKPDIISFHHFPNAISFVRNRTAGTPVQASPAADSVCAQSSITLRWRQALDATSYHVQIGTDSTFAGGILTDRTGVTDTSTVIDGLTGSTAYYWRVCAVNTGGSSYYSAARRFTTLASLPITLSSLTARRDPRRISVVLEWKTETEIDNHGFEIERSPAKDGTVRQWTNIGFVAGTGTSNAPHTFSFIDASPLEGRCSYRLKQIDNDGAFTYSGSIEVEQALPREFSVMQNYPNPFNASTTIKIALPAASRLTVKIYGVLGNEIATLNDDMAEAGVHQFVWEASRYPSGVYFLHVQAGQSSSIKRMVQMK